MDTPTLQTDRLILRPLALSHAPAIQRHFNNWNIIQNLATVLGQCAADAGSGYVHVIAHQQTLRALQAGGALPAYCPFAMQYR